MASKKDFLEKMGGFDEAFQFAHYDGDLFVRLGKHHAKLIFNPRLNVRHFSSPTTGSSGTRSVYWLSRDYTLFLRKLETHGLNNQIKRAVTVLGWFSVYFLLGLSTGRLSLAISSIKGFLAGLRIPSKYLIRSNRGSQL
jgi:GT2 family glycosyltransferase